MKINGRVPEGPNVVPCVLPRQNGDLVFKAKALLDFDEFEKICPEPEPPIVRPAKGEPYKDLKDKKYLASMERQAGLRMDYLVIKSLEATEGLEWDTVQLSNPDTWKNYKDDLKNAGISAMETNRIIQAVMDANCLNEQRLKEAFDRFTAGEAVQEP